MNAGEEQVVTQYFTQAADGIVDVFITPVHSTKLNINGVTECLRKRIFSLMRRNIGVDDLNHSDLEFIANVLKPGKIYKPKSYDLHHVNVQFSKNIDHIFADRVGHQVDSLEFRSQVIECVKNINNHLGSDLRDNQWFSQILFPSGAQLWAQIRGDVIINCGINNVPKKYNCITGLSDLYKKQ